MKYGHAVFESAMLCLLVCLLGATPLGAEEAGRPKRLSPVIFPVQAADASGRELAFGMADRAGGELFATGNYNHFHLKQVLALVRNHMLSREDFAQQEGALKAATIIGAEMGVFGSLKKKGAGWDLSYSTFDLRTGKTTATRMDLPGDAAMAVERGGRAMAEAVAKLDGVTLLGSAVRAHPSTNSGPAMDAYLSCFAVLVEQPMGLRKSYVIDPEQIAKARSRCEEAVRLDPRFSAAWGALSFAYSLSFMHKEAARALEFAKLTRGYVPFGRIAYYWMATRFHSSAEGAQVLRDAIKDHPGALLFMTYLGEHLNITRQYQAAQEVWDRYLEFVMKSPFAMAQKGYSLARLGKLDEAIQITGQAVGMDPDSLDLKLELASRLVDAKKLDEALDVLKDMVQDKRAWGEVLLRLGYVHLLKKNDKDAQVWFDRALAMATGPNEWRTRGRARYDLAIVMARKGKLEDAEQQLLQAADEGFMMRELLVSNADLKVLAARPKVKHLFSRPSLRVPVPMQASPFPTDEAGMADPDAKRPKMTGFTF